MAYGDPGQPTSNYAHHRAEGKRQVMGWLTEEEHKSFRILAAIHHLTLQGMVAKIIQDYIKDHAV